MPAAFPVSRKDGARPGVPKPIERGGGRLHPPGLRGDDVHRARLFGRGVAPVRFGRLAITFRAAPRVVAFPQTAFGFHSTGWFTDLTTFLTCNRKHHVLNDVDAFFDTMHHHVFELDGRDHQFRAADLLAQLDMPTQWGWRATPPATAWRATTTERMVR